MTKNDIKIEALLKKIEAQKKELGAKPKSVLITNGVLSIYGMVYNINVCTIPQLVEAYAVLMKNTQEESYMEAASKILGVDRPERAICGYSVTSWEEDIKNRVNALRWNAKKAELDKAEATLKQMVSEDVKTTNAIADFEKMLGK
jgi:hypothetical protein